MYILTFVHRAHSSGYQSIWTNTYNDLNELSSYLQDTWYEEQFEMGWDDEDMGGKQPTKDEFSVASLEAKLGKKKQVELYGAHSEFCGFVPDQLILSVHSK
jgi:hypothetical protein